MALQCYISSQTPPIYMRPLRPPKAPAPLPTSQAMSQPQRNQDAPVKRKLNFGTDTSQQRPPFGIKGVIEKMRTNLNKYKRSQFILAMEALLENEKKNPSTIEHLISDTRKLTNFLEDYNDKCNCSDSDQ